MNDYIVSDVNVISLFASPIYYCEDTHHRINDIEENHINLISLSGFEDSEKFLSNDVYVLENLAMKDIKHICQSHLNSYTKEVLKIKQDFYITNSWITIKSKGQRHALHNHQNSIFSGVFYLNAEDDQSTTFYGYPGYLKNFSFDYSYHERNIYNQNIWKVPVKTGTMIIFPSHLEHCVDENMTDNNRIVLGFNSFVRGSFGRDIDEYCAELDL